MTDDGRRLKGFCSAVILVVIGLASVAQSTRYVVGTPARMGPGFVPAVLGSLLTLLGVAILLSTALGRGSAVVLATPSSGRADDRTMRKPEWRGWICICLAMLIFGALAERAGLIPAAFGCVFVAALGDRENSLRDALLLAGAVTVAVVIIFWWGLSVLLPLVTWAFV